MTSQLRFKMAPMLKIGAWDDRSWPFKLLITGTFGNSAMKFKYVKGIGTPWGIES